MIQLQETIQEMSRQNKRTFSGKRSLYPPVGVFLLPRWVGWDSSEGEVGLRLKVVRHSVHLQQQQIKSANRQDNNVVMYSSTL